MSTSVLVLILCGAAVGAAGLLLVHALRGTEDDGIVGPRSDLLPALRRFGLRIPFAAGGAVVILVLTQWPVLAGATAALVVVGPYLIGGGASEKVSIARLEGLTAWTESLRDTIAGAVGLEQAIPATAYAAAPVIQPQLLTMSDRLRVRTPLPVALQRFADDMDDASADLIIAALMLNSQLRGPGLRDVLTSLATSAREELEMRRRIVAGRASTRRSVQIVVGISVFVVMGLSIFNRDYVEPYSSAEGQLVLLVIVGLFGLGFWWMRRLSVFALPDRFLFHATPPRAGGPR